MSSVCAQMPPAIGNISSARVAVRAASDEALRAGCRVTILAQMVHPVPPLPRSIGGRRLDIFEAYRANVASHHQNTPIQLYTVEVPNLDLSCKDNVVTSAVGNLRLMDLFRYGNQSDGSDDNKQPLLELSGQSVVIAEGYGANYYHFLLNSLVRLAVVMHAHPQLVFDHVIVSDDRPAFVRQAMEILGIPQDQIVSLARTPRVRCERAWLGQYLSELVFPHSLAVQLLQRIFPTAIARGRRLLIVRNGSRSVTNPAEVMSVLGPRGFEEISCEKMTLAEQIKLFASAEAVVAPHGAGLANLVFCPKGTRVIELMSPRFVETIFWFLATSCGHDHSILIGQGEDPPLANKLTPGGWRSESNADIEVNPNDLRQLCDATGF